MIQRSDTNRFKRYKTDGYKRFVSGLSATSEWEEEERTISMNDGGIRYWTLIVIGCIT